MQDRQRFNAMNGHTLRQITNEMQFFKYNECIYRLAPPGTMLRPGDKYFGERNTGPQLLTCAKVLYDDDGYNPCVISEEGAYPYDLHECRKIMSGTV